MGPGRAGGVGGGGGASALARWKPPAQPVLLRLVFVRPAWGAAGQRPAGIPVFFGVLQMPHLLCSICGDVGAEAPVVRILVLAGASLQ